jgi:hypothetical protein
MIATMNCAVIAETSEMNDISFVGWEGEIVNIIVRSLES